MAQRFIRNLVTSNPSPAYVTRVANAFASGTFTSSTDVTFGAGQRGDMQAMMAAVLLDPEARRGDSSATENPLDGHLREPTLLMTNVLRATERHDRRAEHFIHRRLQSASRCFIRQRVQFLPASGYHSAHSATVIRAGVRALQHRQ